MYSIYNRAGITHTYVSTYIAFEIYILAGWFNADGAAKNHEKTQTTPITKCTSYTVYK